MNRIAFVLGALIALTLLASCQQAPSSPVAVKIGAGIAASAARALAGGETVDPIGAYRVTFKKIEIGNSETDKYTLWESPEGLVANIATAVSFSDVQAVEPGTYNFVRLTIGDTLSVDGSVTDPADGTVYSGTGSCVLPGTVYLWGANIANASGEATLRAPIAIAEGSALSFNFDIAGTVTYLGGSATNAVIGVTKPSLSLTAK